MARIDHDSIRSLEIAQVHNWNITIPIPQFIPQVVAAPLKTNGFLNFHCESTELPSSDTEMADIRVNGILTKQPLQSNQPGVISVSYYEDSNHYLFKFFEYWKKAGSNPKINSIIPRRTCMVARGTVLELLNGEGDSTLRYELQYVYPQEVKLDSLASTGDLQKLNLSLAYIGYEVF